MAERPILVAVDSLDDLYTVEPGGFVAARNALARQLKAAGDRDGAAAVSGLRRPPVSAWALNQVARQTPDLVDEVIEAAGALTAALADPTAHDPRAAQAEFRAAMEATVRAGLAVLATTGRPTTPALQQAMQATLQAAAVDDGIAATLRAGVLAEDEPAPGFLFDPDAATPRRSARRRSTPSTGEDTSDPELERAAARERAERRRRERLDALRADSVRLEQQVERLVAVAEATADRVDTAEAAASAARAAAEQARSDLDTARSDLDTARSDLEAVRAALAAADGRYEP